MISPIRADRRNPFTSPWRKPQPALHLMYPDPALRTVYMARSVYARV